MDKSKKRFDSVSNIKKLSIIFLFYKIESSFLKQIVDIFF